MTRLTCSVHKCIHNDHELCSLHNIKVGVPKAHCCSDTECESFSAGSYSAVNSAGMPASETTGVSCTAEECVHNRQRKCAAERISIGGENACSCGETCCNTFRHK